MKDLLKIVACGSVDDGKSTLLGHLLKLCNGVYNDQIQQIKDISSDDFDYSLLLDGLSEEREQKITIDVAYRYFSTTKRSFIVADAPGHEQYTSNMAVGASFADVALILLDVNKGLVTQSIRHFRICRMFGINNYIFLINKMDTIGYDKNKYNDVKKQIEELLQQFNIKSYNIIPISAKIGDNLVTVSKNMKWYKDKPLIDFLEQVDVDLIVQNNESFILPIQRVCRPDFSFRGYQGQVESGNISIGESLYVLPSKEQVNVKDIYVLDKKKKNCSCGMPVTLCLNQEVDISRGYVLTNGENINCSDMFLAEMLWMDFIKLDINKMFYLQLGTKRVKAKITNINYKVDLNTNKNIKSKVINRNDIVVCEIKLNKKIVFTEFRKLKKLGSFILIDLLTYNTVSVGIVLQELNKKYIYYQNQLVTRNIRSQILNQRPVTFWFTGLPCSGKTTLACELEKYLISCGKHTMMLDGDNLRLGINNDLSFTNSDRKENIRRVAEVAKLFNDAGIVVIVSLVSPFTIDRQEAKKTIGDEFVQVYIDVPIRVCEKRDTKGLYIKARNGLIKEFTGVTSPYEKPLNPDIIIDNTLALNESSEQLFKKVEKYLK